MGLGLSSELHVMAEVVVTCPSFSRPCSSSGTVAALEKDRAVRLHLVISQWGYPELPDWDLLSLLRRRHIQGTPGGFVTVSDCWFYPC